MRYLENRYGNPLKLGIAIKCQSLRNDAFRGRLTSLYALIFAAWTGRSRSLVPLEPRGLVSLLLRLVLERHHASSSSLRTAMSPATEKVVGVRPCSEASRSISTSSGSKRMNTSVLTGLGFSRLLFHSLMRHPRYGQKLDRSTTTIYV